MAGLSIHFEGNKEGIFETGRAARGDTMESPMADARDTLVLKKRTLENDMRDLVTKFENETGLSITKIRLIRDEVTGNAKPVLQRAEATVELISG
jgi:hypothetical protein